MFLRLCLFKLHRCNVAYGQNFVWYFFLNPNKLCVLAPMFECCYLYWRGISFFISVDSYIAVNWCSRFSSKIRPCYCIIDMLVYIYVTCLLDQFHILWALLISCFWPIWCCIWAALRTPTTTTTPAKDRLFSTWQLLLSCLQGTKQQYPMWLQWWTLTSPSRRWPGDSGWNSIYKMNKSASITCVCLMMPSCSCMTFYFGMDSRVHDRQDP